MARSRTASPRCPRAFLYSQVASELRARIARKTYGAGDMLPSLAELMNEFGVSAITIRRALQELTYEGLLRSHQGRGVFVREKPRIHRVIAGDPVRTIGDEIARAGFTPRLLDLGCRQIVAKGDIATRLQVPPGTRILRHRKISKADDETIAYHTLHLSNEVPDEVRRALHREFLFSVLEECKIEVANLRCEFSATALAEDHSEMFDLQPGAPMLRVDYTAMSSRQQPFILGLTICRADRFIFEVNLPQRVRQGQSALR